MQTSEPRPGLEEARRLLQVRFGHPDFRGGQADILEAVLAGQDCLGILPTGAGKSLCYQLPALLRAGTTLVLSPLIALMKDQVDALTARGLPATYVNSHLAPAEVQARLRATAAGRVKLLYAAPERLRSPRFLEALGRARVGLVAVDEAHCISQWGHDFRPDYLRLAELLGRLGQPQVLATTATATPEVRRDILTQLGLGQAPRQPPAVVVRGFARPNLRLGVQRVAGADDKLRRVLALLADHPRAILYCATRRHTEEVAQALAARGLGAAAYHAGLPEAERRAVQEAFVGGALPVVTATNAFGMGIDRADVRAVVHWDLPGSLEAYYQEAGRAGRDGQPARCELLLHPADIRTQRFFLEAQAAGPALLARVAAALTRQGARGQPVPEAALLALAEGDRSGPVRAVLQQLEGAGFCGPGGLDERGAPLWRLVDPGADLRPLAAHLAHKARLDEARLQRMLRYADTRACRHEAILRYFGDPARPQRCQACDNCLRESSPGPPTPAQGARAPTPGERAELEVVLSLVQRLGGRFGRGRVVQILRGSRARAVCEAGQHALPGHGALAHRRPAEVEAWIASLLEAGCLEVRGQEYPTLALTEHGRRVLGREAVPLLRPPPVAGPAGARAATRAEAPPEGEPASFERLRAWRAEEAARRRIPAYVVFHDRTLRALARARPATLAALGEVPGVGPAKLQRYGRALLDLLGPTRRPG